MKKLFAIILCLAMCFGVLALTASADGGYYVAGVDGLCGSNWSENDENNKMTDNGDGTYSKTYENVPAGKYEFKVTDGTWDNSWGKDGGSANYVLELAATDTVTIIFNAETKQITVQAASQVAPSIPEVEYMEVLGEGLVGITWNPGASLKMTKVSDGVYEYVFESVAAGNCKIKFAANGNWDDYNFGFADGTENTASGSPNAAGWNSGDIWFEVKEESKVTVRLDLTAFNYDFDTMSGATYTITIEPIATDDTGSTAATGTTETPKDPTNPKDGDLIAMVIALLAVSAAGIAVIGKKKH